MTDYSVADADGTAACRGGREDADCMRPCARCTALLSETTDSTAAAAAAGVFWSVEVLEEEMGIPGIVRRVVSPLKPMQ